MESTPPDSRTGSFHATMENANGSMEPYNPTGAAHMPDVPATLQEKIGTEQYFEWANFATTQTYQGVPLDEMDRLDLLSAVGAVMGELYQLQAVRAGFPQGGLAPNQVAQEPTMLNGQRIPTPQELLELHMMRAERQRQEQESRLDPRQGMPGAAGLSPQQLAQQFNR